IQDFSPGAIDARGRLLVDTASRDSWYYNLAMLDAGADTLTPVPVRFTGGVGSPCWTAAGDIMALGVGLSSTLWRYRQ
ncbi:MAG TPA: hypothetical protein VFA04_25715, partial [Bryobacteraceae bacterium]|nr:hypothetical protein [Bryobacteraceae bacterium]